MMIYDISQEIFSCQVYPGDPAPEKKVLSSMETGDLYNLTAFSMCAHNGTHIDAPFHFFKDGKTVDAICLDAFVGKAYVAEHQGIVSCDDAAKILEKAKVQEPEAAKRILICTFHNEQGDRMYAVCFSANTGVHRSEVQCRSCMRGCNCSGDSRRKSDKAESDGLTKSEL
jgi:kynurenine formamidase